MGALKLKYAIIVYFIHAYEEGTLLARLLGVPAKTLI
jgi:hypothetical protein